MNWEQVDSFLDGVYRKSHSLHSRHYYAFGIRKFKQFCVEKNEEVTQGSLYEVLDHFVAWLDSKGLKPKTILDYTSAVKRFLVFSGYEIDEKVFHNKVSMPKVMKILEVPLTIDDVRRLLTIGKPNTRMRALILTLFSSGMRLAEALSVQVQDLDLGARPARANLRAEITKGKRARVTYLSDEAREAIEEITLGAPPERLVFNYSGDIWSRTKIATVSFRRVAERAGLGELLPNHRIHRIHLHLFRKHFITKGSDTIGEHAAHALCGHGFYMDTYYAKSEADREADYLKLMPKLTVLGGPEVSKDEMLDAFNKRYLAIAGYSEEEISVLGDTSKMALEELQGLGKQKSMESLGLNKNNQKIVLKWEVKKWVVEGWDFVTWLPDDEAIIRLPTA